MSGVRTVENPMPFEERMYSGSFYQPLVADGKEHLRAQEES